MAKQDQIIVVVDDDPGMNQAIQRLLTAAGFRAVTYPTAEAVLEAGSALTAACLVLDIHLPGLSGFDLHRRLEEFGTPPPVIFVTAFDEESAREHALRVGALGYFTKPFSGQSLLSAIAKAIEIKEASPKMNPLS